MQSLISTDKPAPESPVGNEHSASMTITWYDTPINATPVTISKTEIKVALPNDVFANNPLSVTLIDSRIEIFGNSYLLPRLAVKAIERSQNDAITHYTLCAKDDPKSSATLWTIARAMAETRRAEPAKSYDRFSLPKIPARGLYTEEARQERLAFAREHSGAELTHIAKTTLDPRKMVSNIEGMIGSVEIPLGVAGPLHITGTHANGLYYAPLATSEGALVASATRGATAISSSGGVRAQVLEQRMLRVPMFELNDLNTALFFADWLRDHADDIAAQTRRYSNFANLRSLRPQVVGRAVHLHFVYETGDAAGQNMTTTCTWQACQWIIEQMQYFPEVEFKNFLIESNLSNDKKVTMQSYLLGRGIRVMAETLLSAEACRGVLKVEPAVLVRAFHHTQAGGIAAGMVGNNINVANVIAAMFTATGQDIACVHESSLAQLHMELTDNGDLYAAMTLPGLVIGTVGGGTNLPQQRECLELLQCAGQGNAHKLAEIIASFCLALDISTLAAVASDQFARAHEKLGRNRPVDWLKLADLDNTLFNAIRSPDGAAQQWQEVEALAHQQSNGSIITELTSHKINKLIGLYPYRLTAAGGKCHDTMVKIKPLDREVLLMLNSMAAMCDARLAQEFNRHKETLGFDNCHTRELNVMSQTDDRFTRSTPRVYGTLQNAEREIYLIVEENISGLELLDSADDVSGWTAEHVEAAINGIADIHSIWYQREQELLDQNWQINAPTTASMLEKQRLWELLGAHAQEEFPQHISEAYLDVYRACVESLKHWWPIIESMPRTLIHNDFNPRNIAFRRNADNGLQLCAYDWELATWHLPQHDLAELLMFVLPNPTAEQVNHYIELHRQQLAKSSGKHIDAHQWRLGYKLALFDLVVNRLQLYLMAHTFRDYKFMQRVLESFAELLRIEGIEL